MSEVTETRPRPAGTVKRLLAAARKCLIDLGVERLSMRAIAKEAGVTAAAIYRHFPNKETLVDRVIEQSYDRYQRALLKDIATTPVGSFERLARLGEAYISFAIKHPEDFKILYTPRVTGPRTVSEIQGERNYQLIRQCFVEAIAAGQIRDENPDLLTAYLWSRVHGIVMLLLACDFADELALASGRDGPLKLFRETSGFVLEGLRPKEKFDA
jgi:AcrR family transcriptional regulator